MDPHWIFFILVWSIVEFVQFLRKKPFRQRMKVGAWWAVVLSSLAVVGTVSIETYDSKFWTVHTTAFLLNGFVGLVIYWFRVWLSKGWSRLRNRTSAQV